jgi:transcription elongation factor Elf1
LETKTSSLFNPQDVQAELQKMRETIQSINQESFTCPFCEDGSLQVADYCYDPHIWLKCKNCGGQVRLSKRMPEPVLERRDASGEWEIDRITTDRDARTW